MPWLPAATALVVFAGLATLPLAAARAESPPQPVAAALALAEPQPGWRASRVIGSPVFSEAEEQVGAVVDLILLEDGRVAALVLGVGGFLGVGTKYVAVPAPAVRFLPGPRGTPRLVVAMTREALREAPAFDLDAESR
ncbi:PRC-barrel domain-containing protein [Roseomonas sp. 18066]|uniref:PRC-barrel domain-containing protein n=1 Tax=Roseomonas sp. 18066 TaxID=2681412 RepID=UPI00135BB434|nr:PRC-barrel domain-containing protein [Roseomonas sp. 18066]